METQTLTDVVNTANQMSMWDLVWASDMVTKVVMIGLIAASVWSWAIIIEKFRHAAPGQAAFQKI